MRIKDISVPDIYTDSADFRFFLRWFELALSKVQYDTEHGLDLYDPEKCPANLLWMLADTMGYKYDDRLPTAFNRFVLLYFMSMIRNRGSKDGVTLAAEANLKQFDIETVAGTGYTKADGTVVEPKDILYDRLEDTSIPVNSVAVTPHTAEGYIDVVYFSDRTPIDACIEYVRPLGMYCFQNAGVRMDARTKISIDARLTNSNDVGISLGPTHVGHYSRTDYARMQRLIDSDLEITAGKIDKVRDAIHTRRDGDGRTTVTPLSDIRRNVWYRNADFEGGLDQIPVQGPDNGINPGYRALYSLQLCNNEHIMKSLIPSKPGIIYPDPDKDSEIVTKPKEQIFGLGWQPQDVTWRYDDDYVLPDIEADALPGGKYRPWNLRYDKAREEESGPDVYTIDADRSIDILNPRPAINPVMKVIGDGISVNPEDEQHPNTRYVIAVNPDGTYPISTENISKDGEVTAYVQNGELTIGKVEENQEGTSTGIFGPEDALITEDRTILKDADGVYIRASHNEDNDSED